ncbi:MAG TPA: hypothetical protein VJ161_06245, partial [Geobacteraceae bacterium]|nr:hypothetical protein [Geobacteraceae bacterium]
MDRLTSALFRFFRIYVNAKGWGLLDFRWGSDTFTSQERRGDEVRGIGGQAWCRQEIRGRNLQERGEDDCER